MNLKKDLFRVFNSNVINLLVGIINGFLVPAFLSLDQYASLKTFTLYLSYAGILHFGFIDGIYIKYGGKEFKDINIKKFKGEHKFLVLFQLSVTVIATVLGVVLQDWILIAFSIAILPFNVQTLFKFLYQAIGEFGLYSHIVIITPTIMLIFNLLLIFVVKIDNFWPFVIVNIISYYIVYIFLEFLFLRKYRGIKSEIDMSEIFSHFKIGSFIMIGNFAAMLFYSADRWFVKFALTSNDFAFYSFAISLMAIVNTLINSVTMTFYPYLARGQENTKLIELKKYLLMIGMFSSGAYFAFEFIIGTFMEKYIPSLDIIAILFAGFPAMIIVNAIYVNLYKANKQERLYVYTVLTMVAITVIFNFIAVFLFENTMSIAIATTITFYIWYIFSLKDYPILKPNVKEVAYIVIFFVLFFGSQIYLNWLWAFVVFYLGMFLTTIVFYKQEVKSLVGAVLRR